MNGKLPALTVTRALADGTKARLADGNGLYLRVDGRNKGSWIWRGRIRGTTGEAVLVTLGRAPEMGLAEARRKAMEARQMAREGRNPTQERRVREIEAQSKITTFGRMAEQWIADKKSRLSARSLQGISGRLANHILPSLGAKPFIGLERRDFIDVIKKCAAHGRHEQAVRVASIISQIDEHAANLGIIESSRAYHLVSALPDRPVGEERKHRAAIVDRQGFRDVLNAIWSVETAERFTPVVVASLKLFPLACVRASELLGARWEEVDLDAAQLSIPGERMKEKRPHVVPLCRTAVDVLRELRRTTGGTPYVFKSSGRKVPHVTPDGALSALRAVTGHGRGEISIHGFRASWSTLARECGVPSEIVEAVLDHKQGNSASLPYDRATYLKARAVAMQWWDYWTQALMRGDELPPVPDVWGR